MYCWWGISVTYFSDGLGLVCLLGVVGGDTLSFEFFDLGVVLFVGSEQIDIIIASLFLLLSRSWGGGSLTGEDCAGAAGTREGGELGLVGFDMFVPASDIWVAQILGKCLENGNIGLRWGVAGKRGKRSSQL